jgi:hypothetical protein
MAYGERTRSAADVMRVRMPQYASFDQPPRARSLAFWLYVEGLVPGEHATAMRCRRR